MKLHCFFIIAFCFSLIKVAGQSECPIVPHPTVYKPTENLYHLGKSITINPKNLPDEIKAYLVDRLVSNFDIRVVLTSSSNGIEFKKMFNVPKDSYTINIHNGITINYSSEASCFYAVVSLLQLIQGEGDETFIQECFISDQPLFQWRGLHLDVSRHFFTVEEVKRYIDLMALYKFNTFHWHLTDDQGWRIEIKKYPKLTEIGAWRDSTLNNHYSTSPRTYTKERYGGYYTQEQVKEVVEYAKSRFVTVVPEIEMPGHARAALAAYPQYSCTMEQQGIPGIWGVFEDIFCSKEQSINFLKDILDEVLVLFPSEYIHIGGDEAPKSRWNKCPRCQAVIRENGLKDEQALQSFFIRQIDEYLMKKGRKLIGWDEILEGGLSPNASVMSWRGEAGGIEAAKQNHFVVMSPGSHCYFDHYQSANPDEPIAIGGFTPIEKVYDYNPIPKELSAQEAYYILGAQANLWTEYMPNFKHVEYMTYPRALALAQVVWSTEKPPYEEFKKVLIEHQLKFLKRFDVNYSNALFYPEMKVSKKLKGVNIHFKGSGLTYKYDLFTKSDATHQSMGGGQVVTERDSLYFERTEGDKIVNYNFKLLSENASVPSIFKIKAHPSLGMPVDLITQPNSRYSGQGSFTLVDGIKGSKPWKGNEWLGFDVSKIEFIIDMESVKLPKNIQIGFLADEGSWIHTPDKIEIHYSKNGKRWKKYKKPLNSLGSKKLMENYSHELDVKAKYIKVVLTTSEIESGLPGEGNIPWTFIDELILTF